MKPTSLEWAVQVSASAPGGHLEVRRATDAHVRTRVVIYSMNGADGANVLDIPARLAPALRDMLVAMFPPGAP